MCEGSLEGKRPTIWRDGKAEVGRVSEEKKRSEKIREEKQWEERNAVAPSQKVGKSRFAVFSTDLWLRSRKVSSLKWQVRSHLARWEMKNCTPLRREAHFQVKSAKKLGSEHFGSWDVEIVHAVVARTRFELTASDHFWKLRCRKSVRYCGAKHISKSRCTKHFSVGALLEVEMSKMPLWREAQLNWQPQTTFGSWDVEKVCAVVARSTFKLTASGHFWKLRCRKSARRCGSKHISKSKVAKTDGFGPLLEVEMSKKCMPLWREARFQVKSGKNW